jgi:hypothetical protein
MTGFAVEFSGGTKRYKHFALDHIEAPSEPRHFEAMSLIRALRARV